MNKPIPITVSCQTDPGIDGKIIEDMPFIPVVGDEIKIGGDWKRVVKRTIELNNMGWDGSSIIEITVTK
jgi:hypothetical protein